MVLLLHRCDGCSQHTVSCFVGVPCINALNKGCLQDATLQQAHGSKLVQRAVPNLLRTEHVGDLAKLMQLTCQQFHSHLVRQHLL